MPSFFKTWVLSIKCRSLCLHKHFTNWDISTSLRRWFYYWIHTVTECDTHHRKSSERVQKQKGSHPFVQPSGHNPLQRSFQQTVARPPGLIPHLVSLLLPSNWSEPLHQPAFTWRKNKVLQSLWQKTHTDPLKCATTLAPTVPQRLGE